MKLDVISDTEIIIYLNKLYFESFDYEDKDLLEEYFRNLFSKLKKYYNITITGYYNISVYTNIDYGMILHMNKVDIDYINFFSKTVDMKVIFNVDSDVLYCVDNYFITDYLNDDDFKIYNYHDKFYVQIINHELTDLKLNTLVECSDLIFGDKATNIINKALLINK